MRHLIILIGILIVIFSCQGHNSDKYSGIIINNQITDTVLVPKDSNQLYFPLKNSQDVSSPAKLDSFTDTWYSKQLFAMREPVIYLNKLDKELYRFTWLRTFDNPIAIRIEKSGDSYFLYWKQCNGAGGYEPGKLIVNKQKKIDKIIWNKFKKHLNKIDFWDLKTDVNESGKDGSQWILEGKAFNNYHVVDRWTPSTWSKYYDCCDFLIELTDIEIESKRKY